MKTFKILFIAAGALAAFGCASFNSGDVQVDSDTTRAIRSGAAPVPFSEIQLEWNNYPPRHVTDAIAGGTTIDEKGGFKDPERKFVPASADDTAALLKRARQVFSAAGLYNRDTGRGTLRLNLTSTNRWTYGELFKSYLVETGFIFIIPSSLRVNYLLTADFETSAGAGQVTTLGQSKTIFHLLLAPLYPLFAPGGRETSLLKKMLRRSAADIRLRIARTASPSAAGGRPAPEPSAYKTGQARPESPEGPAAEPSDD